MAENFIRAKQINQSDLSGFVQNVIDSNEYEITYGGTGININNVAQINLSGVQLNLIDSPIISNLNVSGDLTVAGTIKYNEVVDITTTGNISGYTGYFQTLYANNLVYNTDDQTINGTKTFNDDQIFSKNIVIKDSTPENPSGYFKLGDGDFGFYNISGIKFGLNNLSLSPYTGLNVIELTHNNTYIKLPPNKNDFLAMDSEVVHKTGNETINGTKTFNTGIVLAYANGNTPTGLADAKGLQWLGLGGTNYDQTIYAAYDGFQKIGINFRSSPTPTNLQDTIIFRPSKIEAFRPIEVSGNVLANNLVYNTGNQSIGGEKTFDNNLYLYSGLTISRTFGNVSDVDINLLTQPYTNTKISIGLETGILGKSINSLYGKREIKIWETGGAFTAFSDGPFVRIGSSGVLISEKIESKVGIGTLFPTEKVHISGGNLKVEGDTIANNLVYNTGNQNISGTKNFQNTIQFSGQNILVAPADYIYITGNQTSIINGTKYLADTTSASFGFNLPASPNTGDYLEFLDPFYTWSGNNFILSGNGNNIESDAVFTGDIEGVSLRAIFVGKTYGWRIKYNL